MGPATASHGEEAQVQVPAPVVELTETQQQPTVIERVDQMFSQAVNTMDRVLFYRLWAHQWQYVETEKVSYYARDRGAETDFVRVDRAGIIESEVLTTAQVEAQAAQDRLVPGPGGRAWRLGKIGSRLVELVTVKHDVGTKYVWNATDQTYRKLLAKRHLTSETEHLSQEEIGRMATAGQLRVDRKRWAAGDPQPYLHTERDPSSGFPLVVLWLACGSVFFTVYMGGVNLWGFRHALDIVRGKYDNPAETGEVTHFQALASALSATVGLGNIAGVTIAMTLGGPGAFFWMMVCGLFGMTSKFVECTLGQKYRRVKPDGTVLGGPMTYLHEGLKELGLGPVGAVAAVVFAVMCILASFGGGNMFQANQSGSALLAMLQQGQSEQVERLDAEIRVAAEQEDFASLATLQTERKTLTDEMERFAGVFRPVFGVVLAVLVGVVIVGGIRRIGAAAEKLVPSMCAVYIATCLWIIFQHLADVPMLIGSIFTEAFHGNAFGGGLVGVLVVGVQRAAFSNEAGIGSAAIAHSAARTEEPVREGAVALLGPFIDTVVICSMTALVILITGAWNNDAWVVDQQLAGAALTSRAFKAEISWFPYVLGVAVVLFAYSTIISWSYYGERCWERLFGPRSTPVYKGLALICVFVGTVANLGAVLDFSDMMILAMAFPNVLGCALLAPKVKRDLADYWRRYRAGEFETFR